MRKQKSLIIITFLLLSIASNIFGLLWLTVAILLLGVVLFAVSVYAPMEKVIPARRIRRLAWLLTVVIIPTVLLRLFVFEVFNIPSSSMEGTLIPADRIVVNKLLYGP